MLIAFALALLVIAAGMKLLIHTKKELLGNFYKFVSWFVIAMGFLMFVFICCSAGRMCFKHERMMKMMEEKHHSFYDKMGDGAGCFRMMQGCCCDGMMMKHHGGMMKYHGCKVGECDEEMEECIMKKHMEKDSIKN
jgi:hypothetical protein